MVHTGGRPVNGRIDGAEAGKVWRKQRCFLGITSGTIRKPEPSSSHGNDLSGTAAKGFRLPAPVQSGRPTSKPTLADGKPFSARNAISREHKRNTPPTTPPKAKNRVFQGLSRPQTEHKKHYRTLLRELNGLGLAGLFSGSIARRGLAKHAMDRPDTQLGN